MIHALSGLDWFASLHGRVIVFLHPEKSTFFDHGKDSARGTSPL
jgi:hypothetical protein